MASRPRHWLTPHRGTLGFLKWLLFLAAMTLLLDWIVAFIWGNAHLRRAVAAEAARIEALDQRGVTRETIFGTANALYQMVFVASGIHDIGLRYHDPNRYDPYVRQDLPPEQRIRQLDDTLLAKAYTALYPMIEAAMLGLQLLGLRLGLLSLCLPLFLLVTGVAIVDGWVQRRLRVLGVGRESSWLYHRAKNIAGGMVLLLVAWLGLPVSVDPRWVIWPAAALLGVSAWGMAAWFKKYL